MIAALLATSLLGIGGIGPNLWILWTTRRRVHRNIDDVPQACVALVLGCAPKLTSGQDNVYFTERMAAAAELVAAGKVMRVVVSGGPLRKTTARTNGGTNEAECMQRALIELGVPAHLIDLDAHGVRTMRSVGNLVKSTERRSITVVSQAFHTPRAVYLAARAGLEAHAYNARSPHWTSHWSSPRHLKIELREVLSRIRAFWER